MAQLNCVWNVLCGIEIAIEIGIEYVGVIVDTDTDFDFDAFPAIYFLKLTALIIGIRF